MMDVKNEYKFTELGEIPNDWEFNTLDSITIEHKQGYYTKEAYSNKGTKLIRITDLHNQIINYDSMPKLEVCIDDYENYKVNSGDFLFARSGAIGRYGIVREFDEKAIFASYIIRFKFNQKKASNDFIGYFYQSDYSERQLTMITQGSSNININANNIKSLKIPLPPLKEQKKIAEILSTVDEQINQTNQLIEKTKKLKKGLMKQILTKGIMHTEFKQSELGEIPVKWEVKKLSDVLDIRDGTHDSPKYVNDGIPFLTSKNLGKGKLDFSVVNYITEKDYIKFSERSKVENGDILFGMIGTVGNPVIIDLPFNISIKNVALVKFNNSHMINKYVLEFLDSELTLKQFNKESNGGVQKFIALGSIRNLKIIVPPIEEQKQIAEIISSVDTNLEGYEQENTKYEELKKGLMQQLLTGKTRVKVD